MRCLSARPPYCFAHIEVLFTGGVVVYVPALVLLASYTVFSPPAAVAPGNALALAMVVEPPANVTLPRLVQLPNAPAPIEVTLAGMVILARLAQPLNMLVPITPMPSAMVTLERLSQFMNIRWMLAAFVATIVEGIVTLARYLQSWNAD